MVMVITILVYFCVLWMFSRITAGRSDNDTFYRANRQSPWYLVAFGMIGASVSGVSFVSVPGMVMTSDMTYMQTVLGFVPGYFAVAYILLPVYYKLNLTTIYSYLRQRFGKRSYKTGAAFFLLSKITGSAVKFYVVCILLQGFVLDDMGIPFAVTVAVLVGLIWIYTRRGGMRTLVVTDSFQTFCMLASLVLITYDVLMALGLDVGEAFNVVATDTHSRIFVFDDWLSKQNFWKQFVSGFFLVIVMTGLDQDVMQKNLTCKNLHEARKDMCSYGLAFIPVNLLFLGLGILLMKLAEKECVPLPETGDELLPLFAATGALGPVVVILFTIGIVAASFSTADSALTSLTTSYCVDICERPDDVGLRRRVHFMVALLFASFIILFRIANSTSLIDAIYTIVSYTYGPLLGLFAFGLLTRREANDKFTPYIAVASPLICLLADYAMNRYICYKFGYELLLLNGIVAFAGLWLVSKRKKSMKGNEAVV